MRLVAREFNQSETTFVLPARREGATWRLRSFTPTGDEVVGAGHNALGAWWWLAGAGRVELDGDGGAVVAQEIGDRVLPVEVLGRSGEPDAIAMQQAPPEFLAIVEDHGELAAALGLERADLAGDAQVVSTGAAHLMVPLRDRERRRARHPGRRRGCGRRSRRRRSGLLRLLPRPRQPGGDRARALLQPDGRHLGGPRDRQRRRSARQPAGGGGHRAVRHAGPRRAGARDGPPEPHPGRGRRRPGPDQRRRHRDRRGHPDGLTTSHPRRGGIET